MRLFREATAAALAALACGCLSAPGASQPADGGPGGGRDASPTDAGPFDPVFHPCPDDSVDYWGADTGHIDDDGIEDLVLVRDSLDSQLRGIEIRLSSDASSRHCAFSPALHARGVRAADFLPGGDADELLVLAFDGDSRRHIIVIAGGIDEPAIVSEEIEEDVEPGHTLDDPYEIVAVTGPLGRQVMYGGPSAALSDAEETESPQMHLLRGPNDEAIGTALAIALQEVAPGDLRAFVATAEALYWYNALQIVADGPLLAQQKISFGVAAASAGFGDFEPGPSGGDGCPDLAVTSATSPQRAAAFDLLCGEGSVTAEEGALPYLPAVFANADEGLHIRSGAMDASPGHELLFFGLSAGDALFIDARTDVRFDEDPDAPDWECGAPDEEETRELCGAGASVLNVGSQVGRVGTARGDLDGDGDSETIFVGEDDLVGCVDRQGPAFTACD